MSQTIESGPAETTPWTFLGHLGAVLLVAIIAPEEPPSDGGRIKLVLEA